MVVNQIEIHPCVCMKVILKLHLWLFWGSNLIPLPVCLLAKNSCQAVCGLLRENLWLVDHFGVESKRALPSYSMILNSSYNIPRLFIVCNAHSCFIRMNNFGQLYKTSVYILLEDLQNCIFVGYEVISIYLLNAYIIWASLIPTLGHKYFDLLLRQEFLQSSIWNGGFNAFRSTLSWHSF